MIELIPFMLIVLQWHPDHPGQFVVERRLVLFETEQACKEAGVEYVEGHEEYSFEYGGAHFSYKCLPLPDPSEYDEMLKEIENRVRDERGEQ
ncbi:MAG: hypothetical protein ACK5NN_13855 [Sphingomonadaceae bacterium]